MKVPNSNIQAPEKRQAKSLPTDYRQWIEIGDLRVARLDNGVLWMSHREGEGMEISNEAKLAKLLANYFRQEF